MTSEEAKVDEPRRGEGWPPWVVEWILPYVDDSLLWPVLFALLAHVAVVIVPLMTLVIRSQSPAAAAVLFMLAWLTVSLMAVEWRAIGRPGALTAVLGLTWGVCFPFAWYTADWGVF